MNKGKIKISVIIPICNDKEYIQNCIDSVAAQTIKNIEILCVCKSSDENSRLLLNEYMQADERFVMLTNDEQPSLGNMRNAAIKSARGEYVYVIN